MNEAIVNKVAGSGIITINLEEYLPKEKSASIDLKDFLYMGLILKEKDFREALKNKTWEEYKDKNVAIMCTADAIIPVWAYMLLSSYLQPYAAEVFVGTPEEMNKHIFLKNIEALNAGAFAEQRIVIKGCGEVPIDTAAYAAITKLLQPHVKSIMYGEPCSTVPVYKKKKEV